MSLSASDIVRIASLARLQLAPDESERMLSQLNGFFDVVERMREDVVSEPDNREANQRSAPAVEAGLFLVPKVIE